jgi:hypothetical protein
VKQPEEVVAKLSRAHEQMEAQLRSIARTQSSLKRPDDRFSCVIDQDRLFLPYRERSTTDGTHHG